MMSAWSGTHCGFKVRMREIALRTLPSHQCPLGKGSILFLETITFNFSYISLKSDFSDQNCPCYSFQKILDC